VSVRLSAICVGATDVERVARFWAAVLGGAATPQNRNNWVVRTSGVPPMWIDPVPEPKVVKNRVHLDVTAPSLEPLLELGATVLADHGEWHVLADPEGNELCAMPAGDGAVTASGAPARLRSMCVDSARPVELAAWWQARLGGWIGPGPDRAPRWLYGAAGLGATPMMFVPVPDERVVKNRWHWDVETDDLPGLVAAGATVQRTPDGDIDWTVLTDPDGNVFCAFAS
jgi:Glyoxalase-like domain